MEKKKKLKTVKKRVYYPKYGVWASDLKEAKKLSKLSSNKNE